jgi:hypothetical protein
MSINREVADIDLPPIEVELEDGHSLPGVIAVLGELKPRAIITKEGVAHLFGRHPASVKRAVERGELPPPTRLFGCNAWTVGVLVAHIEERLSAAAKTAQAQANKIARLMP